MTCKFSFAISKVNRFICIFIIEVILNCNNNKIIYNYQFNLLFSFSNIKVCSHTLKIFHKVWNNVFQTNMNEQ